MDIVTKDPLVNLYLTCTLLSRSDIREGMRGVVRQNEEVLWQWLQQNGERLRNSLRNLLQNEKGKIAAGVAAFIVITLLSMELADKGKIRVEKLLLFSMIGLLWVNCTYEVLQHLQQALY